MRHLHLEFICSSLSLGLSMFFFGAAIFQLVLLSRGAAGVIIPLWLSFAASLFLGGILAVHAVDGIHSELRQPKRRRHVH